MIANVMKHIAASRAKNVLWFVCVCVRVFSFFKLEIFQFSARSKLVPCTKRVRLALPALSFGCVVLTVQFVCNLLYSVNKRCNKWCALLVFHSKQLAELPTQPLRSSNFRRYCTCKGRRSFRLCLSNKLFSMWVGVLVSGEICLSPQRSAELGRLPSPPNVSWLVRQNKTRWSLVLTRICESPTRRRRPYAFKVYGSKWLALRRRLRAFPNSHPVILDQSWPECEIRVPVTFIQKAELSELPMKPKQTIFVSQLYSRERQAAPIHLKTQSTATNLYPIHQPNAHCPFHSKLKEADTLWSVRSTCRFVRNWTQFGKFRGVEFIHIDKKAKLWPHARLRKALWEGWNWTSLDFGPYPPLKPSLAKGSRTNPDFGYL